MSIFSYIAGYDSKELAVKQKQLNDYISTNNTQVAEAVKLDLSSQNKAQALEELLDKTNPNDTIIIDSMQSCGRTTFRILELIVTILKRDIDIYFLKENICIYKNHIGILPLLANIINVEKEYIFKRVKNAKTTRVKKQIKVGRKKGYKTKSIFEKHRKIILELHQQEFSNTKILAHLKKIDTKLSKGTSQSLGQYIKKIKIQTQQYSYIDHSTTNLSGYDINVTLMNPDCTLRNNEHLEKKPSADTKTDIIQNNSDIKIDDNYLPKRERMKLIKKAVVSNDEIVQENDMSSES